MCLRVGNTDTTFSYKELKAKLHFYTPRKLTVLSYRNIQSSNVQGSTSPKKIMI